MKVHVMTTFLNFLSSLLHLPTQQERDDAYLAESADIYELEFRMRQLDQTRSRNFR
jgi:hypothetical protein